MSKKFNAQMLILARKSRGLTQAQLSKKLQCTQGKLSKAENDLLEPTPDFSKQIAEILQYPEGFFYQSSTSYGLPISFHRKRKTLPKRAVDRIESEINIRRIHIARMLESVDLESAVGIPQMDIDKYDGDASAIAEEVRALWNIPPGPIQNLVDVIERVGGFVVPCDFGIEGFDAISMRLVDLPPLIFINSLSPMDRTRFSMAHEIGHLVMHSSTPNADMEKQADGFAAAFLMPEEDIKPYLKKRMTLADFASLKPVWRVSMGALIVRTKTLKIITERQYSYFWMAMGKRGWRRREPPELDIRPEKARMVNDIIQLHLEGLGYSMNELAKALHLFPTELKEKYWDKTEKQRGHLKVVR